MRWRLLIALLCAAVSFGFNSNPAGSGGAVAGGNCTGGQFMTGITVAGVPVCGTPSGGAPLTNPAGGQNNYAPLAAPTFTGTITAAGGSWSATTLTAPTINATTAFQLNGVAFGGSCSAGSVVTAISAGVIPTCSANLGTLYAPLTNPAGGQNNYAPIASPTFTGLTTSPQINLTNTSTSLFIGSSSTPNGSMGATSAGNAYVSGGAHFNGTNWVADNTTATILWLSNAGGVATYENTGLTVGNTFTANQIGSLDTTGFNIASGVFKIGGTQIAAANLGDYATGNFSPVLAFGGASTGITYSAQGGAYVKVGNLVSFSGVIVLTNKGTATGSATITLPYASRGGISPGCQLGYYYDLPGLSYVPTFLISGGSASLTVTTGAPNVTAGATNANFANDTNLQFNCTYVM